MENFTNNLSSEEKKRFTYIEGREDLFETKVLSLPQSLENKTTIHTSEILVISRNPGSASSLMPVVEILNKDPHIKIDAIVDGRAQEIFQKKFNTIQDITPKDGALTIDSVIKNPDLLCIATSETEQGIETYATSTFEDAPVVLLEDYYRSTHVYLKTLQQRNMRWPEKICVMDEGSKKLIIQEFPELIGRIEVTGQPAFDRFALEDTSSLNEKTRKILGLSMNEKLVTFMSSLEGVEFAKVLASTISQQAGDFMLVFRRHPRDNTTYDEYEKIFKDVGLVLLNTDQIESNDIGAASDLIITSTSTESLHAIYRRKPTLNIVDNALDIYRSRAMPPSVELGASTGVSNVSEIADVFSQLLDSQSELNQILRKNMEQYYPQDGKNAERVTQVIEQVIHRNKNN